MSVKVSPHAHMHMYTYENLKLINVEVGSQHTHTHSLSLTFHSYLKYRKNNIQHEVKNETKYGIETVSRAAERNQKGENIIGIPTLSLKLYHAQRSFFLHRGPKEENQDKQKQNKHRMVVFSVPHFIEFPQLIS